MNESNHLRDLDRRLAGLTTENRGELLAAFELFVAEAERLQSATAFGGVVLDARLEAGRVTRADVVTTHRRRATPRHRAA